MSLYTLLLLITGVSIFGGMHMASLKEQFQYARELIQNQQYDDARHVLHNIDHPAALAWLERVNEFDPPKTQSVPDIPQEDSGGWISKILSRIKSFFLGTTEPQAQAKTQVTTLQASPQAEQQEENADENNLRGSDMAGVYLRYAQLEGADLRSANFTGAYLFGANLEGANLSDAVFIGANLIGANLRGAILHGSNFSEAHLIGANLLGTDLRAVYLNGAKLPDKTAWTDTTDLTRFTNPNHPNFWQPAD